jgi:hypothetical protein
MGALLEFKKVLKTYQRERAHREAEKMRLIARIGINPDDAPLYDEELRLLAWQESLKGK